MPTEMDTGPLLRALKVVRSVDDEMPAQTLQALAEVCAEPGIEQSVLMRRLGMSGAATSRIVSRLGEWASYKKPGLNLVEARPNPMDRRYALVYPTASGVVLMRRIMSAIAGEKP